jgi:ATP-dependent DNA helicase PIF1
MEHPLTPTQQAFFDLIENTNDNYWILGKPGVGKSVLIRALTEMGMKHYVKAAPTGLAATNIDGKTLHSIFGIPVSEGIFSPDFNRFTINPNVLNYVEHTVKHLIIDEVSMVRSDMLDFIDRFLRFVKHVDEPFGGIQVIAVGDFFQLPPIVNKADKDAMQAAGWRSEFAFDAKCTADFKPLVLEEVLRQKGDDGFIKLLHSARTGEVLPKQLQILNKRVEKPTTPRLRLTGTNKQALEVNTRELSAISSPIVEFHANNFGTWPEFPAETVLTLKVGAQVLIKKNGADRPPEAKGRFVSEVVNGSLGIVREICEKNEESPACVRVELRNGHTVSIYIARWERKEKERVNGVWCEKVLAAFEQMPLQLAWAISMHKSQGQSFEFVHVDPSAIFAAGQLYVALSRARSLAGLSLESPCSTSKFWTNKRVLQWTKEITQKQLV